MKIFLLLNWLLYIRNVKVNIFLIRFHWNKIKYAASFNLKVG